LRLWFRLRCRSDGLRKGVGQLVGVLCLQIAPAGILGETGNLLAFFLRQPETDHMDGEVDTDLLQFARRRTGIGLAGLDPVGHKDDRRLVLRELERLRRLADGVGQRRLALRVEPVDRIGDGLPRARPRRDNLLDIRADALLAMAISNQPQLHIAGNGWQNVAKRFACDLDLGLAVDLPPHRPGGIHDDYGPVGGESRTGGQHHREENKQSQDSAHGLSSISRKHIRVQAYSSAPATRVRMCTEGWRIGCAKQNLPLC
jgi:hypothetical protein